MTDDNRALALSVFAGEIVLAIADEGEREAIIARFRDDRAFNAELHAWEMRLAPLAHAVPSVPPSHALWRRIASETINSPSEPSLTSDLPADEGVVVGLAEALAVRTRHLESKVKRWRWATAAASALAAGIALFAILGPRLLGPSSSEDRRYVAVINSTGELPPLVVSVDLSRGELSVQPVALTQEPDKALELWAVPRRKADFARPRCQAGASGPLSAVTAEAWRDPGLLLAVSVEPPGGSTTGQPTGPVVYKGKLIRTGE